MIKKLYRLTYSYYDYDGDLQLTTITVCDTIENISKRYRIYTLIDDNGNMVIDNRKDRY